jgi:MoxR-like ATPase
MSTVDPASMEARAAEFRDAYARVKAEISKVIVGHDDIIHGVLTCLFVGGHALLEGVPGLGKTLLIRTLADSLSLDFNRIQFTPDLMPADIIGTNIVMEAPDGKRQFVFQRGPIFSQIVLADEINRATPKTQSAMLEAMQEHSVTVARKTRRLAEPFFVLATQNPLEMEGTYPLPEAQLDRFFFKIDVPFPSVADLVEIANRTTTTFVPQAASAANGEQVRAMQALARGVPIANHVVTFAARLIKATHPEGAESPEGVRQYVRYGASPRGMQAMILGGKILALLDGRYNVAFDDIRAAALPALRHRMAVNFEAQAEGISSDRLIGELIQQVEPEKAG